MNPIEIVEGLAATVIAVADVESCRRVLHDYSRIIAWAEAGKIDASRRLSQLAAEAPEIFPEQVVAEATRVSLGKALQPFKRAKALAALPTFDSALANGDVSVAHVDIVTNAIGKLDAAERARFAERDDFLAGVAERSTPDEFARTVRAEVIRCQRGDGLERLARQKRATYLKAWVDQVTGMWCVHGEFAPETGAQLNARLVRTIEKLFHDRTPDTAPDDPLQKQQHLRALALVDLVNGEGAAATGVDMTVLIDATSLVDGCHDDMVIDCGLPIDLPVDTIRRMACVASITPIIVAADGISLYLGQTTRLASRDQRRVLRAMYRTCAVPGCCVTWDQLVIHHLRYFRNLGPTDIDNLLPLCVKHHHCAHEGRWQFSLAQDRTLTINLPDGTTMTTGPPQAFAA